ncbi:uncharacterized protein LOC110494028 isoform X3 [Oncorhynchus mykiss]|uniref:uncharacterized protein LOC110494028 isoform X3 n=1 Tax=Oncorhynchus mykiss TaxID=8022 RepID=UPI001877A632|nr:uncharacterized protein LOC110494028 isoform X3 [Oncorhynchus mykiss]
MVLFIPDMAGHLFLVILLFVTFQYIEAQGPYPKPDITITFDEDLNIICLIPGSFSPDTTCNLYVGEESQPSFTVKIKNRKATSAPGQNFCQFTPKHSDLISRLQSVRRKEVSCDYRVSSGPNSLSPRSDGYSFARSTVSSTWTPNTPARPTTNSPTKCLTSRLTPSTALNPSSGSTVSSTLTTDTPSKGLTSPLTPSTAVNPTSGGQSSTESVLGKHPSLADYLSFPTQIKQLKHTTSQLTFL